MPVNEALETTRRVKFYERAAPWAVTILIAAAPGLVAIYKAGSDDGNEDQRLVQVERETAKLREDMDWMMRNLIRNLFRAPATPPAGEPP